MQIRSLAGWVLVVFANKYLEVYGTKWSEKDFDDMKFILINKNMKMDNVMLKLIQTKYKKKQGKWDKKLSILPLGTNRVQNKQKNK